MKVYTHLIALNTYGGVSCPFLFEKGGNFFDFLIAILHNVSENERNSFPLRPRFQKRNEAFLTELSPHRTPESVPIPLNVLHFLLEETIQTWMW